MADGDPSDKRKAHHTSHSGRKAGKKKGKKQKDEISDPRKRNPKAFAIQSVAKAERRFRRTMDIQAKKLHVPEVSRIPVKPSPAIVAVIGPPKVGKTTLMQCIIKNLTKQNMSTIKGPVTLVSGKKKRLTLIECDNDMNKMIDIAKIADLVLLLIDANSGFEMETFEFLNICHVHGMPRIMGVLTHLDLFKNKKTLQRTKAQLKKRYHTEIPRGEKMFFLSGILHGMYLKNEVHNLVRFISIMKFGPSDWQKRHPYVLADRMEDITDPKSLSLNPKCDRTVCLYGYARGGALKANSSFHIPGCGDYVVKSMNFLPDPCPLPEKTKHRSLNEKERLIYAPMSGVGGIVYDKDAVYIDLRGSHSHMETEEESKKPEDKIMTSLIAAQHPIDTKMATTGLSLFAGADPIRDDFDSFVPQSQGTSSDSSDSDSELSDEDNGPDDYDSLESDDEEVNDDLSSQCVEPPSKKQKKVLFEDELNQSATHPLVITSERKSLNNNTDTASTHEEGCEDLLEETGHVKWKEKLMQKAANAFYKRQEETVNLEKLVYGERNLRKPSTLDAESDSEELGGLFHVAKHEKGKRDTYDIDGLDCSKFHLPVPRDWNSEEAIESIKDCFVTGNWSKTDDAQNLLESDDELFGDYEEYDSDSKVKAESSDESDEEKSEVDTKPEEEDSNKALKKELTLQEKRIEKKRKLKELFNSQYDDNGGRSYHDELKMEADEQTELNQKEFEDMDDDLRVQYEGFRPGLYLRIEIDKMPCEFVRNFDPCYPVIIGSLLKGEEKMGYVQVRIKKHRWYPKILKSHDPLIFSLGWRRFQTIPVYFIKEHNFRNRYLKYTPKHLHCSASFWGPMTVQKSGFVAVQTVSEISKQFRIAALGSVLELDQTTSITKKLKLIGNPMQIFCKTAFIDGMFHSAVEVAKFEGGLIRTVSGIRGQIKKALRKPPGVFRATFEDKILMSDIVFLRTWVKMDVPQFCAIIYTLLLPPDQKTKWQGMKTSGQLRYERGLKVPVKKDSEYIPIERKLKQFAPLVVPKNIQKDLPFKDKIIHKAKKKADPGNERVAVIREPREREVSKLMEMMKTIHNLKMKKKNHAMWLKARAHRKQKRSDEQRHQKKLQEKKKQFFQRHKSKK